MSGPGRMDVAAAGMWTIPPGRAVTLTRIDAATARDAAAALFPVTPIETFRYFLAAPTAGTPEAFVERLVKDFTLSNRVSYLVRDRATGAALGSTSYLDIRPEHRGLEIGFTWYAPSVRGTKVNPECKLLLLRHAFETLSCVRVQLKCDAREHAQPCGDSQARGDVRGDSATAHGRGGRVHPRHGDVQHRR